MMQLNHYFGKILIAKVKPGPEVNEWYLFLPHEEVHRSGGRGPFVSIADAEAKLWEFILPDQRKFVIRRNE